MNEVLLSYTKSKVQLREIIDGATALQGLPACYSTTSFIAGETVKAVSSQSLDESKPIVMLKCGKCFCGYLRMFSSTTYYSSLFC